MATETRQFLPWKGQQYLDGRRPRVWLILAMSVRGLLQVSSAPSGIGHMLCPVPPACCLILVTTGNSSQGLSCMRYSNGNYGSSPWLIIWVKDMHECPRTHSLSQLWALHVGHKMFRSAVTWSGYPACIYIAVDLRQHEPASFEPLGLPSPCSLHKNA